MKGFGKNCEGRKLKINDLKDFSKLIRYGKYIGLKACEVFVNDEKLRQ